MLLVSWVEVRDAADHPTRRRTATSLPATENYLAPNVRNAEVEEPLFVAQDPSVQKIQTQLSPALEAAQCPWITGVHLKPSH